MTTRSEISEPRADQGDVSVEARLDAALAAIEGQLAVAVSGGVDSVTLATFAHRAAGYRVEVFHAVSPAVPEEATERVKRLAVGPELAAANCGCARICRRKLSGQSGRSLLLLQDQSLWLRRAPHRRANPFGRQSRRSWRISTRTQRRQTSLGPPPLSRGRHR